MQLAPYGFPKSGRAAFLLVRLDGSRSLACPRFRCRIRGETGQKLLDITAAVENLVSAFNVFGTSSAASPICERLSLEVEDCGNLVGCQKVVGLDSRDTNRLNRVSHNTFIISGIAEISNTNEHVHSYN